MTIVASIMDACTVRYLSKSLFPQVHFLYQYSLKFFLDIFQVVLTANPHLKGLSDHTKRLHHITYDMFQVCVCVCGGVWAWAWACVEGGHKLYSQCLIDRVYTIAHVITFY